LFGISRFQTGGESEVDVALLEVIVVATLVAAAATITRSIWEAVSGLRAKRAAQEVIARRTASDEQLRRVVKQFGQGRPADALVEVAAETIRESLKNELSKTELRRVGQGLNQSNKSGERRYIEALLAGSGGFFAGGEGITVVRGKPTGNVQKFR
jgi:hypothetical protein